MWGKVYNAASVLRAPQYADVMVGSWMKIYEEGMYEDVTNGRNMQIVEGIGGGKDTERVCHCRRRWVNAEIRYKVN